jgi:tetratricopeptide (TPR) repeat protein
MDQARYDEASQSQEKYLELSRSIGNHMAESYAPAYLGFIELSRGNFGQAEEQVAHSLKLARPTTGSGWSGLNQALDAMLAFYKWLENRTPGNLSLALEAFGQAEPGWQGLDEAGEFYAAYAIACHLAGDQAAARQVLQRAHQNVDESWTTARVSLEMAEALVEGNPTGRLLDWFKERGFNRWVDFIDRVAA